jgi:hypothetical protein
MHNSKKHAMQNIDTLPVIQGLWIGESLSVMERLSVSSFLSNGYPFHLYIYNEVKNIPVGCVLKDANKIIEQSKIFKYKDFDSYAGFSNMFRYKLLYEKGNYWVDMDVVCLRPFPADTDFVFSSEKTKNPFLSPMTNNGVIKAPVGSDIMNYCYTECTKRNTNELKWGDTGPKLINAAVKRFYLQDYIAKPEIYCPVNWWKFKKLTSRSFGLNDYNKNTLAIHFWNELWKRYNIDKNGTFPPDSIYEQLKQLYLCGS